MHLTFEKIFERRFPEFAASKQRQDKVFAERRLAIDELKPKIVELRQTFAGKLIEQPLPVSQFKRQWKRHLKILDLWFGSHIVNAALRELGYNRKVL